MNFINNYLKIGEIFVKSLPARFNSKIKEVSLNINQNNVLILEKNRQDILNGDLIGSSNERFNEVDATLNYDKEKYEISIRIKGDRLQNFFNSGDLLTPFPNIKDSILNDLLSSLTILIK